MTVVSVPTEAQLRAELTPVLGLVDAAELDPDANLVVLGLSSLELMRMVGRWNKAGVPAVFEELVATPTLTAWLRHFAAIVAQGAKNA
ncbi:phosphopantetheine-binding protein [Nocardia sp. CA-119907]|uniref:phosphopantetheine-binding protein n=1 Tax=Nocardia sp. CA-119907 TaxID=3239973 RepID=UPI003D9806A6